MRLVGDALPADDGGPLAGASYIVYQVRCGGANKNRTCDLILIRDAL